MGGWRGRRRGSRRRWRDVSSQVSAGEAGDGHKVGDGVAKVHVAVHSRLRVAMEGSAHARENAMSSGWICSSAEEV